MKRTRKQRLFSILLVISMIMQQTFVLPAVAEDHVETETAAAVTQTAEAPETKAAKTEVQEQKAPETQAPVTEAPKPEVQETKETPAPATEAPKPEVQETQETPAPATEAPKPEVQETQETPAPATEAPVTEAPQTEAPVTEAPQTEAPVTEAPQTEAPVTEAPQTEAPVTEAPETEAPVTEAPETEAPVTEAPETEAPATEAPETETEIKETETETESETESETETEAPKTHFTYEDGRVRITADASESAKLPQDAVLKADYLAPGSAAYNAAVAKVKAAYGLGDDVELECAPYDIYFVSKGNRIEPENGTVKVTIQFVKPVLGEAEGDLIDKGIAHIKDNGSVEDLNGSVNTNAQGAVSSVGFTTDSFSVFAPFTVSQVTAQAATSSNLNQFVTNVVFDNNLYDADGALVLHPNSEYSFKMEFAESIDKGLFEKEGVLTYTFPAQLTPAGAGGTFDMNITAGETQYTLSGNTYTIEGNTIKVSFNKDGGAAYEALKAASNAEFWLSLRAKVDANASGDKIKFGDSVEKTVKFDNTADVSVEKSGSYDKTSGKMNYTVKVKSTGTSTNVKVTDVITGTLLTYDKNVTATSNQKGALTVDPNATAKGNGFEYTIPSMSDGEEVTFSYSASVDYSKLSGDKFTADETKNTVTAKGDNTDEVSKDHNFDHTTAYDTGITKSGTKGEITNGWQTSNWTITVNADAKTDVGGSLVTDKIQENKKVPTKYSGAGITVKKYKADGTLVSSEPIPWDQLKSHSDTTWSYELPQKDGTPYKYEISYTTTSDISKTTENTSVTNHAEFDGKGTDGSVGVEGQNQFGVTKTHAAPSKDGVNWTVDVTIPNCGFNESFTITDALPFTWTGGYHADSYKEGSLQIAMNGQTIAADNYDIKYTAPVTEGHNKSSGSIQVVFKPEKLAGLFPATTGTERVLTMTYTTIPDSTWPDGENHTNTVTATGDGTSKNASDSYILKEHEISKSVENGNATIGGMPAYKFKIYLRGVDTDTLEIHDIFDPDLFEIVTTDSNSYNNAQFGAGDESWIADNGANGSSNGGTLTVTPTETGATFSIKNVATKSGGAYYSWYSIRYYLKVKDAEALKKIQQEAAKNPDHTTKIGNTAEWEGKSTGEVSVDYKVNPLTKTETGSPSKLNHYTSTFTVVVNPDKLQLNGGNDLTVKDTFSDAMELVTDSVQITLEPEGTSSWDFDKDKKGLTVTIPDECKATITYQAQIIGTGTVTYKNNVTVTGNYTASTGDKTAQITTDGEGSAEHFQYKVIKRDANDKQKRLQGAIFQLFERKDGSETAVKNNKTGSDVTFTTDANGEFMMAGAYQADGWELTKGHTYVLKEIQAPEGYKKADPLTFTVGSITADGAHGNGYTFDIYDEEGKDIDISVVKTWNDADNQDGKRPESVMVQLYANGQPQRDPVELNAGNSWSYKWEKLPDKENGELITYTVRELQRNNEGGSMTPVADGAEITYLVNDENVTYKVGYSNTDNDWTISNTHTPETTKSIVSKLWLDNGDQDGKRPDRVTMILKKKVGGVTTTVGNYVLTAGEDNGWTLTVDNLAKYENGEIIDYFWEESQEGLNGYVYEGVWKIEDTDGTCFLMRNRHIPETIDIEGSKIWDDANNQDGKRPSEIKIHLFADGAELTDKVQTVTASNNWSWKWENLPKYAEGKEIVYTIAEDAVENYMTIVDGYNVTNMHIPVTINISGGKDWNDANNQDGKRPGSITIRLYADGTELTDKVQTVTAADNWEWTFTDLPKYTNGREINYTITEDAVAGYTTSVRGYNVTNTHTPETIDISGSKTWNDADNQDGKRPREIKIHLFADGTELTDKVQTVTASNAWSWKWENLPKYANGKVINYTITEDAVANYTTSVSGYNVTNTYTPEVVRVVIRKVWNDADNQDGKRPAEIKVDLKKKVGNRWNAPNELVQTITLNEGNGWKVEINNLPKYTDGKTNIYNWSEHTDGLPKGYYFSAIVTEGEITTLTNSYKPEETSVSVQKVWNDDGNRDGIRPDSITVTLYAEAEGVAKHEVKQVTLNEANNWTATVSGLAKYVRVKQGDEEYSKLYTYTWEEENVPAGYTLTTAVDDSADTVKTIFTNTHIPEKVEASVTKVWNDNNNQDGKRPAAITVRLYGKAGEAAAEEILETTLNEANNWKYTKTELPKFKNGVAYTYYWTEETQLPGYTVEAAQQNGEKSFVTTLTNTHAPEKTSATVEKRWRDNDNQDQKRPESITVILKKSVNGLIGTVDTYTLTAGADGSWKKTVDNLPKYENGTEIQYFWEESQEGLNGYQPLPSETANNMTLLVNAYTPEETSVSVQKVWNDDGNRDRIRPESITVTLYAEADGVAKHKVDEAVLNETNHWAATKSGLAKNVNGKPYTYTWEEENVPDGYTLTTGYDSEDTSKTILTNTHTPETVNATVVKAWDDADNQDGKRPQDLTVTLMKNETVVVQTVTLDAANSWTAKVENLAKNENGTPIRYSWVEGTMPEGYSLESTAVTDEKNSDDVVIGTITTLTNTYAPGKVSASVKKVWDDENNQDGIRPETLRVNLLKNGQATDQFVILSEENRWSATLNNLDEYTDGTLNEYTWSEELPDGYTVTVSDPDEVGTTTLTNTHTPATIGASVEKTWDDNDDQDGKRPEKLLVTLMRRIREQAVPISLDDADDADTNPAEEVKTVELTAAHNWKASVSNLPKYKDGQMYEYFWTEKEENIPDGYELTNEVTYNIISPGEGVTGFITKLTNTHTPQKINAVVKKVWDDSDNQDGKRAPELTVELMRNGTEVAGTVTLNEENNWTGTVENLDKYTGGVKNGYTWVEKNLPDGYSLTKTEDQTAEATEETAETIITTLTNSYTPGKVEASVLKVWNDGENQDGIRPGQITVILVKNDELTTQSVTLSEANHWTAAITGLDEYTDGTLNEYTWKEAEVPDGYTLTNTKKEGRLTTLTNTHTPEVVNATIRKTWNDSDNQDGVRPTEIKVDLKKNDQIIRTVTLDTANGWETTVEDLPKYTNGRENIYTWAEQEDGLPEGYELTGDVTEGEVTTLTNTRVPDTVSVGVRKIWDDAENQDGIRPSELRVDLLKNGELTGQYVILNEENGWTATITNLPKNTAVAEPNVYTWSEELPDGYTVTVSDPDGMGITTLTNTHTPATIDASVEKTWDDNDDQDGKRPEKLLVTLMRRIREQAKPLSADDADTNPAEEVMTVELTAANGWKASVSNQPKYKDGQMYEYFWTEKKDNIPDGYKLTNEVTYDIFSSEKGVTGFITTLTNSHKPQKINATVKKVWDDNNNQDGKRAPELTVDLMRNGTEVAGTVTLSEENGWTGTVENLDKYTGGVENVYTWAEKNLPEGYSLTETKKEVTEATEDTLEAAITTLTNKHTPGKVSAEILKIWDDAKNQDGKRPETITAILVKNGEETDQKVTLSAENGWSAIITNLDEYTNGTLNKYTWKEAKVPEGYELTLNKTDGTFTTLTNTHVPELVNVSVRKEWNDADNQDGIRPAELKVDLKKNGEVIATVTLNEENGWSDGVNDLPKYTAGVENIYTWAEQEDGLPEGYELTDTKTEELLTPPMEGEEVLPTETVSIITTLTNTHTPETVVIEGTKTWYDGGNEGARPESITIRIYADGEELTDLAKTVTAADDWKWSFTDLPKYKEGEVGQEITYTITEDPVDGYISEVDGYDVTNTRSAAVSKVDIGTGEELTGAHFQVLDGAGNIVDEWDSESGTNHVIKGIKTDVEYTLHESKAPEGYEVTADVTFTVAKDGTVTATASVVNGVIIVEDKLKPSENTSTTIEKKITYNGLELFAENLSFYVRLFYDEACTKPATELKEIKIVNAMSGKVTFDNLEAGRTYYVGECDADGNVMYSGVLEDGTVYTPVFTGTNGQVVTVEEGEDKVVYLDNQLQSWPHNFYAKGTLTVTKKLLGADGEAKDSDEVFYAGIFDDPEYTTLSERVEYNLLELDMSGGSETSMSTNVQIESLDSVTTLYVTEVDEDGNPVKGAPGFAYEVSADKTEVNIDPKHTKAEVTITNKEKSYEGKLTVTKELKTEDGNPKDSDETFYAGIFDDADFTQLSDKVEENILTLALNGASEVTAQTKVKVDSADSVTTLYVTEVDADGNPVKKMAGFKYGVSVDKEEVEIAAGRGASVIITNVELPHNPYQHGELTVTKKLLGADGKPKNSNGVFYAGIFDDPEYTTLSDKAEYNILELDLNGNAEASAMTKVDIAEKDSTVTLYVTEVDEEGNPIAGAAGFKYEVSVDQTKVDLTVERSKAVVVITNKEVPETETESETQPTTKPTKGVKTGDDTPIGGYAGLMAIAFAAFALLVVSEQKRRKSGRE